MQGLPGLCSMFRANLGNFLRPYLKNKNKAWDIALWQRTCLSCRRPWFSEMNEQMDIRKERERENERA